MELVFDSEVIKYAGDHKIDQLINALWAVVEARTGGHYGDAHARQLQHILQMDLREGRLTGE